MRAALALVGAAVVALGAGAVLLAADVADWFGHPLTIDSFAGLPVFRDAAGELASFPPFDPEPGATLVGVGLVLVPVALVLGAALTRRRVY